MSLNEIVLTIVVSLFGIVAGTMVVHAAWRAIGAWRIKRAGPRPLDAVRHVLWRDPGEVAARDLRHGPGGSDFTPQPPFTFIEEHSGGSQPCVSVRDARGRRWRVKWGDEVRSETLAVRLVWAVGYFAEITHFVAEGRIENVGDLQRARACIDEDCRFRDARFELDDPSVKKLFEEHGWAWDDNPFLGTRELQGLKILVMLLSNWDTKDRRDVARGSNTAIFEYPLRGGGREARYLITDWGGSMGRWGGNIATRGRWDPGGYEDQTPQFITAIEEGLVRFGYSGQRTEDVASGITVEDVRWLYWYLDELSDAQLFEALRASGANDEESARFGAALRNRIAQLRVAAEPPL
jgi:hypothetical protein